MNYPSDFIRDLKGRASDRCECERGTCHPSPGRCSRPLIEGPMEGRWLPVKTGDRVTFPPEAPDFIALCDPCIAPRTGARRPS